LTRTRKQHSKSDDNILNLHLNVLKESTTCAKHRDNV
jgi:hypothetical protein